MNFSFESIKPKSKNQNEDFYFDLETSRGHFFAVLDFAQHDYANLNATLKGKLETIVNSFVSLSRFAADLFLGFTAKEINNFLFILGEQSGGPDLLCSGVLCLVSGNRVSYLGWGDVRIDVVNGGRLLAPATEGGTAVLPLLGDKNQESPLSEHVQVFTLKEEDVLLVSTPGVERGLKDQGLADVVAAFRTTDAAMICEGLIKATNEATDDRTLLVIGGPYEKYVEPVLADLSTAVASMEARLKTLEVQAQEAAPAPALPLVAADPLVEQRLAQQFEVVADDLRGKASRLDLLELEEKIKNISTVLASKADTAEVLGLQSEVLKLGIAAEGSKLSEPPVAAEPTATSEEGTSKADDVRDHDLATTTRVPHSNRSLLWQAALLSLVLGIGGGLLGGWLQARANRRPQERWSVKSSSNQILITRLDQGNQSSVAMNVSAPPAATGEQTFASFAEVKQYIDTITSPAAQSVNQSAGPVASPSTQTEGVTEITIKPGDSLKKLAQQYNVPAEKIMELNPSVTRWPTIQVGTRIVVPAASPTPPPAITPTVAPGSLPNTIEIVVVPGDSINRFAMRYKTTPDKIRELNPHITNWAAIQTGQKVLVPSPPAG